MKRFIHFDTSVGSLNVGDQIINNCFEEEMADIFGNELVVKYPTHTPVSHFYQNTKFNRFFRFCKSCDYKFIAGTNILSSNMLEPWPNWNVNILNASPYKGSVLVGVGRGHNKERLGLYTRLLYKRILSKKYIHSVRDESTRRVLEKYGYKAINTGCVTLWKFNEDFCKEIKRTKSENVVFTLTDYCRDPEYDQKMIDILKRKYKKVYYWIQGSDDYEYFKTFKNTQNIIVIGPNLNKYLQVLEKGSVDYVGTRLHAGIQAMRKKRRAIIVIVDNRTKDMKDTYGLIAIERKEIEKLEKIIDSDIETRINIDREAIKEWKKQFQDEE